MPMPRNGCFTKEFNVAFQISNLPLFDVSSRLKIYLIRFNVNSSYFSPLIILPIREPESIKEPTGKSIKNTKSIIKYFFNSMHCRYFFIFIITKIKTKITAIKMALAQNPRDPDNIMDNNEKMPIEIYNFLYTLLCVQKYVNGIRPIKEKSAKEWESGKTEKILKVGDDLS